MRNMQRTNRKRLFNMRLTVATPRRQMCEHLRRWLLHGGWRLCKMLAHMHTMCVTYELHGMCQRITIAEWRMSDNLCWRVSNYCSMTTCMYVWVVGSLAMRWIMHDQDNNAPVDLIEGENFVLQKSFAIRECTMENEIGHHVRTIVHLSMDNIQNEAVFDDCLYRPYICHIHLDVCKVNHLISVEYQPLYRRMAKPFQPSHQIQLICIVINSQFIFRFLSSTHAHIHTFVHE